MLDTVYGVPAHALIVHATVVLLPLAAICGIAIAVLPPLRRRYGLPVGLLTVVAVGLVPVTVRSGEHLFERRSAQFGPGDTAEAGLMERHADLAEGLLPWSVVLLVGVLLVLVPPLVARRRAAEPVLVGSGPPAAGTTPAPGAPAWTKPVAVLAAVVTLVGAVLTLVLVIRIGHAGAEAAWERVDRPAQSAPR